MNALNSLLKRNLLSEIKLFNGLIDLMKPRVMSLVIFTCAVGLLTAPNQIPMFDAIISIGFVTLGAGAAGALNMWYEADLDKLMSRTCLRPIPTGKVNKSQALIFGLALSLISIYGLYYFSNLLSAFILFFTIFFYVVVYTVWLKRKTPQNIVIGGLAGAAPPLLGWAAISNTIDPYALLLVLIIFVWTPPHFWALAIYRKEEYAKESIPMLPVTHGVAFTKLQIVLYTIILFIVSVLPYIVLMSGVIYLVSAIILSSIFMYYAVKLYFADDDAVAMKTFNFSIYYIFLIFVALLLDHYLVS